MTRPNSAQIKMLSRPLKVLAPVGLALLLAACASQPNMYYTLTSTALPSPVASKQPPGLYTLASVSVPAQVDDTLLVVRRSDDQLMKLAHDRWTAPLGKQVGNALAVALTNELGTPPLGRSQAAVESANVTTIYVDVQRFDLVPGQYAVLAATWQLKPPSSAGTARNLICYTELREPVDVGVAPLVKGQQVNITRLAQAIGQAWQTGHLSAQTRCQ
jgi:uncharacterized lipoprotein YmbA